MFGSMKTHLARQLDEIRQTGLYKTERVITSPQDARIRVGDSQPVLNLCANNYLGLAAHPAVVKAAHEALDQWGYGLSSVRFICGTQNIHKQLEARISEFLGTEDTILYSSCFDANGGLFEAMLGPEDAVISDELNHASIIDGVRLCKAQRMRYLNNNREDLEAKLKEARNARFRLIATDGVFSMDGCVANLPAICGLAEESDALVMVDDSHAVGFMGKNGRGTHEYHQVMGRVDLITGTLGKALGGASGGYTSGRKEIIELLRQRSRPYLFSKSTARRDTLEANTIFFREGLTRLCFNILPGTHPIVPIMLGDAALATMVANAMLKKGVYVIGFSYPVVPKGKARIRTQISAAHSREDVAFALEKFGEAKAELGL